jgi:FKBP12-rapamycin complex-associated protein
MRDPKPNVREAAADALAACLDIVSKRESQARQQWYLRILEEAQQGLRIGSVDCIHGSLLIYRELLLKAGMFMHERYREVCELVLKYKDHRDSIIRRSVIQLIPTLASYSPDEFVVTYLHRCVLHLLAQLKKDKDKGPGMIINLPLLLILNSILAFESIGRVAMAVGSKFGPYLDAIVANIKEGLKTKGYARILQNIL